MVALPGREYHDYPTTRTHAVTPADHSYTRGLPALDHPRIVLATLLLLPLLLLLLAATGFCCRRWKLAAVSPELIAVRSVPHFWDTSNQEMQRLN